MGPHHWQKEKGGGRRRKRREEYSRLGQGVKGRWGWCGEPRAAPLGPCVGHVMRVQLEGEAAELRAHFVGPRLPAYADETSFMRKTTQQNNRTQVVQPKFVKPGLSQPVGLGTHSQGSWSVENLFTKSAPRCFPI